MSLLVTSGSGVEVVRTVVVAWQATGLAGLPCVPMTAFVERRMTSK